jgi:anti-sigma B factor antagonist
MAFAVAVAKTESGTTVLALEGKLTVGDACTSLRDAVRRELEQGNKTLVLDMEKLQYIDSSGLGILVSCLMAARHNEGDLAVSNVPSRIRDLLHVCRLDTIIQLLEQANPSH